MKNLILLVLLTACASPDYDYQEEQMDYVSEELKREVDAAAKTVEDIKRNLCVSFKRENYVDKELCP